MTLGVTGEALCAVTVGGEVSLAGPSAELAADPRVIVMGEDIGAPGGSFKATRGLLDAATLRAIGLVSALTSAVGRPRGSVLIA